MDHQRLALPGIVFVAILTALTACKSPPAPTLTVVGLWPEEPPVRYKPFDAWSGGSYYDWPRLDSAQPVLRWESFPRPADRASDTNGVFGTIKTVTYDLRIWRSQNDQPSALAYSRDALPQAFHQVERPLARGAWYFWTVRARFTFHGQTRVTEWSRLESPDPRVPADVREGVIHPDPRYYRFKVR